MNRNATDFIRAHARALLPAASATTEGMAVCGVARDTEHAMNDQKKPDVDNHGNQLNDHQPAYHRARGATPEEAERLASDARKRDATKPPAVK